MPKKLQGHLKNNPSLIKNEYFRNAPTVAMWNGFNYPPPVIPQNPLIYYNEPNLPMYYDMQNQPMYYPSNEYFIEQNPPMYFPEEYLMEQSPSPMMTELARQYFFQLNDANYERQLLQPYTQQYLQQPYTINNYM